MQEADNRIELLAFPAEAREENIEMAGTLDVPDQGPTLNLPGTVLEGKVEQEQEFLDSLEFDGLPKSEEERLKAWRALPRLTRLSIRRLHHALGHKPKSVMIRILRGAKADPELVRAVRLFRCPDCAELSKPEKPRAVAAPGKYIFN